jgi:hypothetical protein
MRIKDLIPVVAGLAFLFSVSLPVFAQNRNYTAVYRFYDSRTGRHLFTQDCAEKARVGQLGFNYEGVAFYVAKSQNRNTVPLQRVNLDAGGYLYTTDQQEVNTLTQSGGRYEGIIGYVSTRPQRNTVPLYRLFNNRTHFYTTNQQEKYDYLRTVGSTEETLPGYVWTSGDNSCDGVAPMPQPSGSAIIYAQTNFNGPAMALDRDYPDLSDWDGNPYSIRSIRVPGRPIMVYEKTNYRGRSYLVTSDWVPQPGDLLYGKIRSIRINVPPQPR